MDESTILESTYKRTSKFLDQIDAVVKNPRLPMQVALRALEEKTRRLDKQETKLSSDNPVLEKTLSEYDGSMLVTQNIININASNIEDAVVPIAVVAVTAKVFTGLSSQIANAKVDPLSSKAMKIYSQLLLRAGIPWNVLSPEQVARKFVNSPAWIARMAGWGAGYSNKTRKAILNGIRSGWSPIYTAKILRKHVENIPRAAAENLTRTLQLTSYREAALGMEKANSDYIIKKIRIATLNDTTCLACIALHGTELRPGERVDDHYRGRCTEFYVVPGGAQHPNLMQVDSEPGKRNFQSYQTGEQWFNSLPEERQRQQTSFANSPAKWKAYQAGHPLSEFVTEHDDDVFGRQITENSLIGMLGEEAQMFYTNK